MSLLPDDDERYFTYENERYYCINGNKIECVDNKVINTSQNGWSIYYIDCITEERSNIEFFYVGLQI